MCFSTKCVSSSSVCVFCAIRRHIPTIIMSGRLQQGSKLERKSVTTKKEREEKNKALT